MKEIKDIKIKSEYNLEEKKEILKKCGFEEIDVVLEKFKKENKLKHDILISETIYEKIKRNKNIILVYLKNGEVINRYSEEHLKENSIDTLMLKLKTFLEMYNKSEGISKDDNNSIATTKSSKKLTVENILENNEKAMEKIKEAMDLIRENINMIMNQKSTDIPIIDVLEDLMSSERQLLGRIVYLRIANDKLER